MVDRVKAEQVNLDRFKKAFSDIAPKFKWFFAGEFLDKIRTKIGDQTACPIQTLGWCRSHTLVEERFVPSPREMLTLAGLDDRPGVILIHHADGLEASRYWNQGLREWLLKTCGLNRKSTEPAPA